MFVRSQKALSSSKQIDLSTCEREKERAGQVNLETPSALARRELPRKDKSLWSLEFSFFLALVITGSKLNLPLA